MTSQPKRLKYLPLFLLIQGVSLLLMVPGFFVTAFLLMHNRVWPAWAWIWWNDDDGYGPDMGYWHELYWLAWRNPVDNIRHVPGVSKIGRPLWYWSDNKHYAKAGWMSNGYPCCSLGSGPGHG